MLVMISFNMPDGNRALSNKTELLPVHRIKTHGGCCYSWLRLTAQEDILLPVPSLRRVTEKIH